MVKLLKEKKRYQNMKEKRDEECFLGAVNKIRNQLERYPNIGFYLNQISDTVEIDKSKVEQILDRSCWVEKRGRRYYHLDNSNEVWEEMFFDYEEVEEKEIYEDVQIRNQALDDLKKELLNDPETLIKILMRERGMKIVI